MWEYALFAFVIFLMVLVSVAVGAAIGIAINRNNTE